MNFIHYLLSVMIALLAAIQTTPNVPPAIVQQAIEIASTAAAVAQEASDTPSAPILPTSFVMPTTTDSVPPTIIFVLPPTPVAPPQPASPLPIIKSVPMESPQPAPQFTVAPHFENFTDTGFDVLWETDIPASATFSIGYQRNEGSWTVEQSFDPATSFTLTLPQRQFVLFYKITITANGQSTDFIGQLPS